jgi:hypothetical protein
MSLIERARCLSLELREIGGLKKRAEQADLFEKRAKDLKTPAEQLGELEGAVKVIAYLRIPTPLLDRSLVKNLRDRIIDLKTRYDSDKSVVLDPFPGEEVRWVLTTPLSQLPKKVNDALLSAWEKWSSEEVPEVNKDVLDILFSVVSLRNSVVSLRSLKSKAVTACAGLPDGLDDVEHLQRLCGEISFMWQNLAGEGIPEDVLNFLRSAGTQDGANFSLLNETVLDWIDAHGLRGSLRIRMM